MLECKCECGNSVFITLSHFFAGKHKSCGCKKSQLLSKANSKHGMTNTPLFKVWTGILHRCYYKKAENYKNYGGKGVVVCDEWRNNFINFYDWAIKNGWEKGLQIDKDIKGNGLLYSPKNCCIVSNKENQNGKKNALKVFYEGEYITLSNLSEKVGVKYSNIFRRFKNGWHINDIIRKENTKQLSLLK